MWSIIESGADYCLFNDFFTNNDEIRLIFNKVIESILFSSIYIGIKYYLFMLNLLKCVKTGLDIEFHRLAMVTCFFDFWFCLSTCTCNSQLLKINKQQNIFNEGGQRFTKILFVKINGISWRPKSARFVSLQKINPALRYITKVGLSLSLKCIKMIWKEKITCTQKTKHCWCGDMLRYTSFKSNRTRTLEIRLGGVMLSKIKISKKKPRQ